MSKSMQQFNQHMLQVHQGGANMVANTHKAIVILATLNTVQAFSITPEQYELVNDIYDKPMNYPVLNDEVRDLFQLALASMTSNHSSEHFDILLTTMSGHFHKLYDGLVEYTPEE